MPLMYKAWLPDPEEMPRTFCMSEKDGKYTLKKDHTVKTVVCFAHQTSSTP